jgi:hypothetical protein
MVLSEQGSSNFAVYGFDRFVIMIPNPASFGAGEIPNYFSWFGLV